MNYFEHWLCGRRGCGWKGTNEEKPHRREVISGIVAYTLVCPRCGGDSFYSEKPLFIPLKTEYFEAFKAGTKDTEYRVRNERWNTEACRIGRRVILCKGYSGERLHGTIIGCHYDNIPARLPGWLECYGPGPGTAVCIKIQLDPKLNP